MKTTEPVLKGTKPYPRSSPTAAAIKSKTFGSKQKSGRAKLKRTKKPLK